LPAFYLILVAGVVQLPRRWQLLAGSCLLAINFISSSIYLFNPRFHRENWKKLASVLSEKNPAQSPVVVIAAVEAPLRYYYAGKIIHYSDISHQTDLNEFWLVPYAEPIFDPKLTVRRQLKLLEFKEDFKQHFRGNLTLVKYTK
jgi:hypothetical protein